MGRPLEFNKEEALRQATEVFWQKGYEATSLQDLLNAMNLSKSSFYQTFKSKHELFLRCLSFYRNQITYNLLKNLHKDISGHQFIKKALLEVVEESQRTRDQKGCLLMNTASEFAQGDPSVAFLVKDGIQQLEAVFLTAIERAQKEGDISTEQDIHALAQYIICSMSGLYTMLKAGASRTALTKVVEIILASLK